MTIPGRSARAGAELARRLGQFRHKLNLLETTLLLTSRYLKFRGAIDVSVSWSEVADVQRAGAVLVVSLHESTRMLRFSCHSDSEAARAGVLAQHLANRSRPRDTDSPQAPYQATL